jgi:hypothetical protein
VDAGGLQPLQELAALPRLEGPAGSRPASSSLSVLADEGRDLHGVGLEADANTVQRVCGAS